MIDRPKWLHWLNTCPSINTWAIDHAAQLRAGDVVFTRRQTAGRGQHNRVWYAPSGVLTASFILDRLPVIQRTGFSLAAGLAVIYAVEDLLPDLQGQLRLKWPNDIWLQERKLAGILCEVSSSLSSRLIVGVGLNCNADFSQLEIDQETIGNPISLHHICPVIPDEIAFLTAIRNYLLQAESVLSDRVETHLGLGKLLPEIRRRDAILGKSIAIQTAMEQAIGRAAGIDDQGRLLLERSNQSVKPIVAGHITLLNRCNAR